MSTKKRCEKIKYGISDFENDIGPLTFGNMLESFRLAEEVTLREFATYLGISPSSLCDLEKGRKIPSISRTLAITQQLGVSAKLWIQVMFQDQLRREDLDYKVKLDEVS